MLNCCSTCKHRMTVLRAPTKLQKHTNFVFASELQSRDASAFDVKLQPPVLFPLEVMVHHLDLRFQYHFSGDKPTNRLDKVYWLSHNQPLAQNSKLTISLNISLRT